MVEDFLGEGEVFDRDKFFTLLETATTSERITFGEAVSIAEAVAETEDNLFAVVDEVPFGDGADAASALFRQKILDAINKTASDAFMREAALAEHERVLGALRRGAGLSYSSVARNYGKDVAKDIRARFGPGIFKKGGLGVDALAGEFGFVDDLGNADGHALIDYLTDKARSKKDIGAQYAQDAAETAGADPNNAAEVEEAARLWREMGTESPYFKRWADGRDVFEVIHFSDEDIDAFDSKRLGTATDQNTDNLAARSSARVGFWFTDNPTLGGSPRGQKRTKFFWRWAIRICLKAGRLTWAIWRCLSAGEETPRTSCPGWLRRNHFE
jgi:hypothetical protein